MVLDRWILVNKALLLIEVVNEIREKEIIVDDKFCFYTTDMADCFQLFFVKVRHWNYWTGKNLK